MNPQRPKTSAEHISDGVAYLLQPFATWFFVAIRLSILAIPLWLFWTVFGIGAKYFPFTSVFAKISYFDIVGIILTVSLLVVIIAYISRITKTFWVNFWK